MKSPMEQHVEGSIPELCELIWTDFMQPGEDALGQALISLHTACHPQDFTYGDDRAERVSAFNNFI